jgi:hypothetical protein
MTTNAQDVSTADLGLPEGFPDPMKLLEALKGTPGCLGAEIARTPGGQVAFFAWFANKQGLVNWYHSAAHKQGMKKYIGLEGSATPLEATPDNGDPILVIASFTVVDRAHFKETGLPLSQLAIEFYQPIPGGIDAGGRFAPEAVTVPKLRVYAPERK